LSRLHINVEDVIMEQREQRKLLSRILQKISCPVSSSNVPESLRDVTLPLQTLDDLDKLEDALHQKEAMEFFVSC